MRYRLTRPSIKGDAGHTASVLERFYNNESRTWVLYSFWKADDHQVCWGAWKQSSWGPVWRRLSYHNALTGLGTDHLPTHNSRYHLTHTKAILITHRDHPHSLVSWPEAAMLAHHCDQYHVASVMLHNIQTDAALISLPGPPTHTRWHWMRGGVRSLKQRKALTC